MSDVAEVTVSVNSRPFRVMCRDGEERDVVRLAEQLSARVAEIRRRTGCSGDSQLLVLAALTLCGELRDVQRERDEARQAAAEAERGRADLGKRLDDTENAVAAEIESAARRIESLTFRKGDRAGGSSDAS